MKEFGRSMVEMLGTLAVIGVLSIAGIAGYRTAMDYYKANEIIDSVSKAATQLSVGLVAGTAGETLVLDETTTASGHALSAGKVDAGRFSVLVTGVEASVCENILNRDWELPLEINAECTDSTDMNFLFANDLSDEAVVTIPLPEGREECKTDSDCADGGRCGYGTCVAEEDYCDYQYFEENGCQDKDPNRPHCLAYRCVAGCTSDDDCKGTENPYCLTFTTWNGGGTHSMCVECMENAHCETGSFCSGSYDSCEESSYNTCRKAKVGQSYTASDGKTYYLSSTTMSWWDADNYCKELGKVVGSDLSLVPAVELNTKGVDGSTNSDWSGTNKTALVGELYTGFGSLSEDWVWTATDYSTSSSSSSKTCSAYGVYLSNGYLNDSSRDSSYRALCWDGTASDIPEYGVETTKSESTEPETTEPEATESETTGY